MKAILISVLVSVFFLGCGDKQEVQDSVSSIKEPEKLASSEKLPFTKKEWRSTFQSTFTERDAKSTVDGITEYIACLKNSDNEDCGLTFVGKYDNFNKVDYLVPPLSYTLGNLSTLTQIGIYIIAIECDRPFIAVQPQVNRKGRWFFIEKAAFMADGEVVVEKYFDFSEVKRQHKNDWIHEKASFILSKEEREAFAKFAKSKEKFIRITGENNYLTIEKNMVDSFSKELQMVLDFTDEIEYALNKSGGPICDR